MPDSNNPQWTPGPWVALSISGGLTPLPLRVVATAPVHVKGSTLIASGFRPADPEASANLQLIAAAPDLYTALQAMLKCDREHGGIGGAGICIESKMLAHAAIAKAKGSVIQPQPTDAEPGTGSKEKGNA